MIIEQAKLIDSHEPGSPEWLEQRRTAVGGSDVAVILGLSPWESRFSLWHRKQAALAPIEDSAPMEWGRRLEEVVLAKWIEENDPLEVHTGETWLRDGWMLSNPDAIAMLHDGRTVVVEVKTTRSDDAWIDGPPVYYLTQVQWYLGVLDIDEARVIVLIAGSDYREYTVTRDREDFAIMADECRRFLDSIEADDRPDIDDSYATYSALRELHPDIERGAEVELSVDLADQLITTRLAHDAAKREWTQAQSLVLDAMGTAQHAMHPDGFRVAYRSSRRNSDGVQSPPFVAIDRKALAP